MKSVGIVFIALGLGLLLFVIYSFIKETNQVLSPLPEEKGVRIIFTTPTPTK